MFRNKKKPPSAPALPAGIEAEISSLSANLSLEPEPKKPSLWIRAGKRFLRKMQGFYVAPNSPSVTGERSWVAKIARWQIAFTFFGWLAGSLIGKYLFIRPWMTALWCVASILPSLIAGIPRARLSFWLATYSGMSGLPLIWLAPSLPWYGPVAQMAFPLAHLFLRIRNERRDILYEENQTVTQAAADPVAQLARIIEKHRQKVIGAKSEFARHLDELENKLSQVRRDRSHWERRVEQHPDSQLFAARFSEALAMERRLNESCAALYSSKHEIMAGLDRLQGRIPTINDEINDWRQDQAHQTLMDEAGILADETEIIVRQTISAFSADIQKIAGEIEGLRIQIAGGTCDPRLIVATEDKAGEIIDDSETSTALTKALANANL